MKVSSRALVVFAFAALMSLTGCATFEMAKPAPVQTQPVAVSFTDEELSGMNDLPIGTYRVPDSHVIISGHQKGGMGPAVLFGLIGLAVQHAANASAGQEAVQEIEEALRINLKEEGQEIARKLISSERYTKSFRTEVDAASPSLSVITAVVMSYVTETDVRPYVVLKASLHDPKTKETVWTTRYFSSNGKTLPLAGEVSWTANKGEELKRTVSTNLERTVAFMLADVSSPYARDDTKLTMVQGTFPHVPQRLQTVGYRLSEDDQTIAFVPKLGDVIVFTGVNLMDKSTTVYRVATKDDELLKIIEEPKKEVAAEE